MSIPLLNQPVWVAGEGGRPLQALATGSARGALFRTADGRPLAQDPNTGFFRVAETGGSAVGAALGLRKPRWQERRDLHRQQLLTQERSAGATRAPPRRTTVGDYTGLCLLIDFPDARGTISRDEVDAFCNQPGYQGFGNNGSVMDYFGVVSNGRLTYRTIVAPYYTAQHPASHYSDAGLPYPVRARELINEALAFHVKSGFDFGALTADPQQAVYATNVLYAGPPAAEWGKGLWPHASRLDMPVKLAPGRVALDYQITSLGERLTLGVYCHENGHMLCDFPDLYQYADQRIGVGRYCLMCLGANPDPCQPTLVSAYLRYRAGWGEAEVLTSGRHRMAPSTGNRFLIHQHSQTEYFIFENRRRSGRDVMLPSSGLAVWHIDELGSNARPLEMPDGHQHAECRLLQADAAEELDRGADDGDTTDLFGPGPGPVFVDGTALAARWWDGTDAGLQIHSLQADGDDLVFVAEVG
jgi:M6 family metalloprotease-like protein